MKRDAKVLKKHLKIKHKKQPQQKIQLQSVETIKREPIVEDELDKFPENTVPLNVEQLQLAIFYMYYTIFANTKIYNTSSDIARVEECEKALNVCHELQNKLLTHYEKRKTFSNVNKMRNLCDSTINTLIQGKFLDNSASSVSKILSTLLTEITDCTSLDAFEYLVKASHFTVNNFVIVQKQSPLNRLNKLGLNEEQIQMGLELYNDSDKFSTFVNMVKETSFNPDFLYDETP